jgi:hypothetical protein
MKNLLNIIFTAFIAAALCLPAFAQEDEAPLDEAPQTEAPAQAPKTAPAAKKPVVIKKKKIAKKAAPASEYKFQSVDTTPAYKFDKKANPIMKQEKKKKKTKAAAAGVTEIKPTPKLKRIKSIGEEDAPETPGLPAAMLGAGGQ